MNSNLIHGDGTPVKKIIETMKPADVVLDPKRPLDPMSVTCPNCQARPARPCTTPTTFGRRPVTWYHTAREDAAKDPSWEAE